MNGKDLLEQLDQVVGEKASKNKYWPKTSSVLSRRINEVKTNLQQVGIFFKEGQQDPITRVKTIVITKPSDIGKMPFEQFEPFDRRGESERPNNDANQRTPNDSNDMNGILHKSPENTANNDVSSKIENANTRSKGEAQNGDTCNETPNDSNDMNGILHKPGGPVPQNITSNDVSNKKDKATTANPKLPAYVYRLGHSDRLACKLCNIRDDKWGMEKHYHPEEEESKP